MSFGSERVPPNPKLPHSLAVIQRPPRVTLLHGSSIELSPLAKTQTSITSHSFLDKINTMEQDEEEWLKPWQLKALKNGREPLPEAPGFRPWIPSTEREGWEQFYQQVRSPALCAPRFPQLISYQGSKRPRRKQTHLPWSDEEIERLRRLRKIRMP